MPPNVVLALVLALLLGCLTDKKERGRLWRLLVEPRCTRCCIPSCFSSLDSGRVAKQPKREQSKMRCEAGETAGLFCDCFLSRSFSGRRKDGSDWMDAISIMCQCGVFLVCSGWIFGRSDAMFVFRLPRVEPDPFWCDLMLSPLTVSLVEARHGLGL